MPVSGAAVAQQTETACANYDECNLQPWDHICSHKAEKSGKGLTVITKLPVSVHKSCIMLCIHEDMSANV